MDEETLVAPANQFPFPSNGKGDRKPVLALLIFHVYRSEFPFPSNGKTYRKV